MNQQIQRDMKHYVIHHTEKRGNHVIAAYLFNRYPNRITCSMCGREGKVHYFGKARKDLSKLPEFIAVSPRRKLGWELLELSDWLVR